MARHPGVTINLLRWLVPNDKLPEHLQAISIITYDACLRVLDAVPVDSPELTEGLRKLAEAKDCFVRAAIIAKEAETDG